MIAASSLAPAVDHVFYALLLFCAALSGLVFLAMGYFLVKYRATNKVDRRNPRKWEHILEWSWTLGTLLLFVPLFFWSAKVFFAMIVPPQEAVEINVVAKQWMWKFYPVPKTQTENPIQEINELHLLLDQPVRLLMISEDVIHSLFIPAFRVKQDVLPGSYTSLWFTPTKVGHFAILCTQYCGTDHARMTGEAIVMAAAEFKKWQSSEAPRKNTVQMGSVLFQRLQCAGCHEPSRGVAPNLQHLFGKRVFLRDGTSLLANENYLRESILYPSRKIVKNYGDTMPSYKGQISEADLNALIEYIKL